MYTTWRIPKGTPTWKVINTIKTDSGTVYDAERSGGFTKNTYYIGFNPVCDFRHGAGTINKNMINTPDGLVAIYYKSVNSSIEYKKSENEKKHSFLKGTAIYIMTEKGMAKSGSISTEDYEGYAYYEDPNNGELYIPYTFVDTYMVRQGYLKVSNGTESQNAKWLLYLAIAMIIIIGIKIYKKSKK